MKIYLSRSRRKSHGLIGVSHRGVPLREHMQQGEMHVSNRLAHVDGMQSVKVESAAFLAVR